VTCGLCFPPTLAFPFGNLTPVGHAVGHKRAVEREAFRVSRPSSASATHGHSTIASCPRAAGDGRHTGLHVGPAEVRPMVWSENAVTIAGTCCYHVYDRPRIAAMIERGGFPSSGP
jgi:hypothetical protein